jgi:hypothetical protein
MIQDQILAEIDAAIAEVRRKPTSPEEAVRIYERLGRKVAHLRGHSIAYRKSERRKGARIREELRANQT